MESQAGQHTSIVPVEKQEMKTGESQRATEDTAANKVEGEEPTLAVDLWPPHAHTIKNTHKDMYEIT